MGSGENLFYCSCLDFQINIAAILTEIFVCLILLEILQYYFGGVLWTHLEGAKMMRLILQPEVLKLVLQGSAGKKKRRCEFAMSEGNKSKSPLHS